MHFPGLRAQVQVVGYSSEAQTRLGLNFVPFPGPSSSGDQVFGEHALAYFILLLALSKYEEG